MSTCTWYCVSLSLSFSFFLSFSHTGGSIVIIDPSMGLERCDHCIATAKPSVWLWKNGSQYKFMKVNQVVISSRASVPLCVLHVLCPRVCILYTCVVYVQVYTVCSLIYPIKHSRSKFVIKILYIVHSMVMNVYKHRYLIIL